MVVSILRGAAVQSTLKYVLRAFRSRPRFFVMTSGAYALGIGMVTGVFSIVDDALLDPLPWARSDRVVAVWERLPEMGGDRVPAAPAKIMAWRSVGAFDQVAAWRLDDMDLTGRGDPVRLPVGRVEPELLPLLGAELQLGRSFTPEDGRPGQDGVAVLGHRFWTEWMGADPEVVGTTLTLEGAPYVIVGVLARHATFPEGAELLVPLVIDPYESRTSHAFRVLAHLAPGATLEEARTRLDDLSARLEASFPETDTGWRTTVVPLRDELVGDVRPLLLLLLAAGGLVFLVACANGASLLLVRAAGRRRELAVRASLGASRGRLTLELAAESLTLSSVGGLAGLAVAHLAVKWLRAASPVELATVGTATGFDGSVYLFTLTATICAGLLFGLLPALHDVERDPVTSLREGGSTASPARRRLRHAIVAGEIALATLLLVASSLLVRSAYTLTRVDPGFHPERLLAVEVRPPRNRYPDEESFRRLYVQLLEGARAVPGVQDAALVNYVPLGGRSDTFRFLVEGRPAPASMDELLAQMSSVSTRYFRTMGISVLRGRAFDERDREGSAPVALVNEAMAREYWPREEALNQRISLDGGDGPWIRIVGVVADVRSDDLTGSAPAVLYTPMRQQPWPSASVVVRTDGDPLSFVPALKAVVTGADPSLPLAMVRTGDGLVRSARARWEFQALLVSVFGVVALALAVTGVFGLMAYVVRERNGEMAVRQALGARAADLRALVGGDALKLSVAGVTLGLFLAAPVCWTARGMLFEVSALDPWSYAGAGIVLVTTALLAAWAPAQRASRVRPAEALRAG